MVLQDDEKNHASYITEIAIRVNGEDHTFNSSQMDEFVNGYQESRHITITIDADASKLVTAASLTSTLEIRSYQSGMSVNLAYDSHSTVVDCRDDYFLQQYVYAQGNAFYIYFR